MVSDPRLIVGGEKLGRVEPHRDDADDERHMLAAIYGAPAPHQFRYTNIDICKVNLNK